MQQKHILLLNFSKIFVSNFPVASFETSVKQKYYDFIILSEKQNENNAPLSCSVLLCPQNNIIRKNIKCDTAVTCGMSKKSTVSFSSVRFDEAMICISRRIEGEGFCLFQGESKVIYDADLTLYENLILNVIKMIDGCIDI